MNKQRVFKLNIIVGGFIVVLWVVFFFCTSFHCPFVYYLSINAS